ncbi:MAG: GAF domain-containing protein [Chloroflexi bacterium]|nr:GAF domain-containing protein [Chloroflexota bacterium]
MISLGLNLRTRMVLLVFLALVPALILTVYISVHGRQDASSDASRLVLQITREASKEQEQLLAGARQLVTTLAEDPLLKGLSTTGSQRLFARLVRTFPQYLNIGMADRDGNVIASAIPFSDPVNIGDRAYFREAVDRRDFGEGEYQVGRITGKPSLNCGYPVFDDNGQLRGVLFVAIDLAWVNELAAMSSLPVGSTLTVIDRNGTALARYPEVSWVGRAAPEAQMLKAVLTRGGEGTTKATGTEGETRLMGYVRLGVKSGGVYLVVGVPENVIFAAADSKARVTAASLAVFILLLLALTWTTANRLLLRPLRSLSVVARRFASGDMDARIGPPYQAGELGQLACSYDELAAGIKARHSELQRRLEMERVTASASGRFIAATDLDGAIDACLEDIGEVSRADRAYLFLFREGGTIMDNTHEWCREGASPQIHNLKDLPVDAFPWWMSKLRKGEVIHITDVSQLPGEAKVEKETLESQHIKSLLVLPVEVSGELAGFIGLDNVRCTGKWGEDDLSILRVSSQMIGNALGSWRAEQELQASAKRMQALYDVGRLVVGRLEMRPMAQLALEEALKAAKLDAGLIRYLDEATSELVILATCGLPQNLEATMMATAGRVKIGRGFAGEVARTGKPIVIEDVGGDERCLVPDMAKFGLRSAAYLPLKAKDSVVGVICGYAKHRRRFKPEDIEVLEALGTMVGMALANARLFERIDQEKRRWEQTFDSMSEGVALIDVNQRILRANDALATMTGIPASALIGRGCYEVIHNLGGPIEGCPFQPCLAEGHFQTLELREPHLGNRWLRLSLDPLRGPGGDIFGVVHTVTDISVEKKRQLLLEQLHNLSVSLASTLDLNTVLSLAVRAIRDVFVDRDVVVSIALLGEYGQYLEDASRAVRIPVAELDPDVRRSLLEERRPFITADKSCAPSFVKATPELAQYGSFLGLPLCAADSAVIGVLSVLGRQGTQPTPEEVSVLETYARTVAFAIENARSYARTDSALRNQLSRMWSLTQILGAATRSLDIEQGFRDVLKRAAEALDVDGAGIALVDESGLKLTVQSAYDRRDDSYRAIGLNLDVSSLPSLQSLVVGGGPITVPDILELPLGDERALAERWTARSLLMIPITHAGLVTGTLQFFTRSTPRRYAADDISLAEAIANHLAPVIENAGLHERTERERSTLESIMTGMGEGLIVVDARHDVLYCNRALEELLGLRCHDFVGVSFDTFLGALGLRVDDVEAFGSHWRDAVARLEEKPKVAFTVNSGSSRRNIEATLFAVGRQSKLLGTGVLLRDVTREREADRMKTEFISIASHELRTPMTSVYGFAELLLMKATNLTKDQRKWVETIYAEGKRLADIVDDLLNVSRIESGHLTLNIGPVSLEPMVSSIVGQMATGHPSHSFVSQIPEGFPPVRADKDKLHQVLYNLVDNAVKYSPSGSPVTISAMCDPDGKTTVVSVSDSGMGIPAEEIPKLFRKFHRVQRPETPGLRGTGLGLYIVRSLLESMGGSIRVESQLKQGSTFYVTLPVAEAQPK